MEALCRLSYSGGRKMIATAPAKPGAHATIPSVRRILVACIAASLLAGSCSKTNDDATGRVEFRTSAGRVETGQVRVADTESERERGLMNVSHLAADDGMVFLFDGATTASFWMKDTLVPLSVGFWNGEGTIVDVLDMQPCTNDPCPVYTPRASYTTALEMNLGWFRDHKIAIGDHADFSFFSR